MSKILTFTDFHTNVKLFNEITAKGFPARAPEFFSTFKWLSGLVDEKMCNRVFFGGDLFNTVADLRMPFFNLAFAGVFLLHVPTDMVDGNHDKYDAIYKALDPFRSFARVHSKAGSYYDPSLEHRLIFLPFHRSVPELLDNIKKLTDTDEPTIIVMHQGLKGYVPDDFAIDKSVFSRPNIERVIGGHYHWKFTDSLPGKKDLFLYPGSIVSLHFDNELSSSYALIYDTKTKEYEFVENPYSSYFVSLTQTQMKETEDKLETLAANTYVRVLLDENESLDHNLIKLLNKFKGYTAQSVTEKSNNLLYTPGNDIEDDAFDYEEFSSVLETPIDHSGFDLSEDRFKHLVLTSNEEAKEIHEKQNSIFEEVLREAYQAGVS